ncbi:SAM-dependent methyltransferase [Actinomadura madurae]|uniref:SAM-dependent methyltransferase n=1 Tax=Actinomadura madurae TaxID=1993 RepID=UPI0020266590|nr:SAM-dependent methyltransferase [Actinomadura madurae]MCQ0007265.1 SAM-dependent methyltransferase [Actinomadura madurae]MCQ0017431.1 SAM-dependent methyltransferase [Actinomadura madurae]URM97535.1 SAM-dependent methyltransferase [Actinomadura madurae]URN08223.1 SAM-dependent methyltransferase [Actinomadura madurae]
MAAGIDDSVPHSARIWNHWIGGKDNYPIDREMGDRIAESYPQIKKQAVADRAFIGRAVRYLAQDEGVRDFLDIGTGLPTVDNTHEVAQRVAPESRIMYVDNDPLVLTHARALLTSTKAGRCEYLDADVHDPDAILAAARRMLDFTRPVAIMLVGILHHVGDTEESYRIVRRLADALPSGGFLVINHATYAVFGEASRNAARQYNDAGGRPPVTLRSPEEILRYFDGLDLVEPGLVSCAHWRPDPMDVTTWGAPDEVDEFAGIARKP